MKKLILLHFTLLIIFAACEDKSSEFKLALSGEERPVEMTLNMSSQTASSTEVNDEAIIELDLVICKNGIYQYTRTAYSSKYVTFRSTLKIDENIDIYFFANCRSALNRMSLIEEETRWEEIQSALTITNPVTIQNNSAALPMWGQLKKVTVSDQNINNLGTIRMLRAVASANIYFTLNPAVNGGGTFIPHVVYVYYGANKAFVAPAEENLVFADEAKKILTGVKAPVSPADMYTIRQDSAFATGNAFANTIFMFDNETTDENAKNNNKRTRLVVGGYFNGSSTLTYYPIHFVNSDLQTVLPVTRNDRYNIFISSVNGEGYPDPDEAADNATVNLNYKVIDWNEHDDNDIAVDGINYLSISSKNVTLYRNEGSKQTIRLSGTYKKEDIILSFSNSLNGTSDYTNYIATNNRFKAELKGTATELELTVTALGEYSSANTELNFDTLRIEAGRVHFDVKIEQINSRGWDNGGSNEIDF
ncbi:MAG: Mfa1 fimbrilin C-terminal domain-containing protein [Tannerellaceae bacterium]|nr:Mfa1 fimbrilin C-terminal domain-containing protein [Tannerellaceae bacterium]